MTTLVPTRKQVGLVGINETWSRFARSRIRDVSMIEPASNRSLGHACLGCNLSTLHPLFEERRDMLITSASLGLTGLLRALLGSRPRMTLGVVYMLHLFREVSRCRSFCATKLSETLGKQDRDTSGQILVGWEADEVRHCCCPFSTPFPQTHRAAFTAMGFPASSFT